MSKAIAIISSKALISGRNLYKFVHKKSKLLFVLFLVFLIGMYATLSTRIESKAKTITDQYSYITTLKYSTDLLQLSFILNNNLELRKLNDFDKAITIRNHLYSVVPRKNSPYQYKFMDFVKSYLESTRNSNVGHVCQGLQMLYMSALESLGIPARAVFIFSDSVQENYSSHATVEFYYQGRWYASDPAFNIMFKSNNQYLEYSELYKILQKGERYTTTSNGFELVENRKIENYYIPLSDLMKYVVIHPSKIYKNKQIISEVQILPNSWDGVLSFKDHKINANNDAFFYKYLYSGPLR